MSSGCDWEREFAGVMKAGGFDAVIGNPPYVTMELTIDPMKKEPICTHISLKEDTKF
jgi:methylase of polypeptide subunit release factors